MMCALIFLEECMGLIRFSELMSYRRWRATKRKALSLIFAFLNPFRFKFPWPDCPQTFSPP